MIALTLALRDLRGGLRDFRLFLGCLIIGVAVIAAVHSVSRHIENGIRQESTTLLGGDVELSQVNAQATPAQLDFLRSYGRVSLATTLRAMALFGDAAALVELKGVDSDYPLLGEAILASGQSLPNALSGDNIIVEPALLDRLNAKVGDTIKIGNTPFRISDVLQKEPDNVANPLTLGPRVMANMSTLQTHDFLLPANLIRYHYHLLLNDPKQLGHFKQDVAKTFSSASWIIKTSNENNRGLQDFIERLQLFMTLAGLSSLLIGGIGITNASEMYLGRKSKSIAILKTLGASRKTVFHIYLLILLFISVSGSFIGALLGEAIAAFALPYLADFLPILDTHFSIDFSALLLSMGFGVLTVFTFAIASLTRGTEVKPALLFRGLAISRPALPKRIWIINIVVAAILMGLLLLSASDFKIAGGFIGASMVSFLLFGFASYATKKLAQHIHPSKPWARLAIANIYRPQAPTLSVLLSIGIGLTVLIALLQVEGNFRREVNDTIPHVAPSLFMIDIQPAQKDEFTAFLNSKSYVSDITSQPMIRGRISKLNHIPVEQAMIAKDAKWAIESDRGLSYASMPPVAAPITKGQWWPKDYHGKTLVSLDQKLARGMGLILGDTITVNILGEEVDAEIANLREVNYLSFQINFAMIFSPGALEKLPATFITTVHIDSESNELVLMRDIAKQFPGVSSVRIRDSIAQIKSMIDHIAFALRLCALVTLVSGVLVLATALSATLDKRIYDTIILKVLGARRADILKMFLHEWIVLAGVTSAIACVLGSAGAWLILAQMDWITFHILPSAIFKTVALALVCIAATGAVIQVRIFRVRVSPMLRNE